MEKKIFVGVIFLLLCVSCVQSFCNPDDVSELNGEFTEYDKPTFSLSTYVSGQYQENMSDYMAQHYAGHNFNVRLYNQLRYSVFHTSDQVVIGKEGWLYEESYIAEAFGLKKDIYCSDEEIKQIAEQIFMIQTEAIRQGKAFIFVFTPSKADFEKEYIPNRYFEMESFYTEEERNYRRLMEEFDKLGVVYIDGTVCLRENAADYPIFYQTGIHWTRYGALTVMNEIVDKLNAQYNMHIKSVECSNMEEKQIPYAEQDDDLYRLLNIYKGRQDDIYYWPEESPIMDNGYELPKLFIQGGSFTNTLAQCFSENCLFSEVMREFYTISLYDYNRYIGYDTESLDTIELKNAVAQADVILLESNVENVHALIPEMYDTIYQYLGEEIVGNPIPVRDGLYGIEDDGYPFTWASPDVLLEVPLEKEQKEITLQLELPLDTLHSIYGNELTKTILVYVNGKKVKEFDYDETILNIRIPITDMDISEDENSVILEILAPYTFRPNEYMGSSDTRILAYKIRMIGGKAVGF